MLSGFAVSAPKTTLPEKDAEFEALTPEEKEFVYRDLYGQGNYTIDEDAAGMIENALTQFEQSLFEIPNKDKKDYLIALETSPDLVKNNKFRLKFLRCELFDPKLAAIRYVRYWKERISLWGVDKAFRRITLDDFKECDEATLHLGGIQPLKDKDRFNRSIILFDKSRYDFSNRKSMARVAWYMIEYLVEDEEAQRNGVVAIGGLGRQEGLQYQYRKLDVELNGLVRYALPVRIAALHHFVSSRFIQFIVPYILYILGSDFRHRYKLHSEKRIEYEELEKFGIPKSIIPRDLSGDNKFLYEDWLEERRKQELQLSLQAW